MDEVKVKVTLSAWLEPYFEVYWDRDEGQDYPTFTTKGVNRKPDLFLRSRKNPQWFQTLIEVKKADDSRGIKTGSKIIDYYNNYTQGKTQYFIEEEKLRPKYFLLGTQKSINGHLYERELFAPPPTPGGEREKATEMHLIPKLEYQRTFDLVRTLWKDWKDRSPPTTLGVLLSNVLDGDIDIPAFMCEKWLADREKWRSQWLKVSGW